MDLFKSRFLLNNIMNIIFKEICEMVNFDMKILVVDDYATMQKIIRNLLGQIGFKNIELASDGAMALQVMKETKIDMVITDWNMTPLTGLDLLKAIRADEKLKDIPVIMITAESKTENVVVAKQHGVNQYIVKPFTADTLKTKLQSVIGNF